VKHLLRKPQDKHKYHSFSTKWQLSPVGFSLSFFDTFFILPEKLEKNVALREQIRYNEEAVHYRGREPRAD
jgi:hypothetical protein